MAVRIYPQIWCSGESISKIAFRRFESGYRPEMPEMHLILTLVSTCSTKFRKTSASKKREKSLEISVFFVFSCLHLNQTRIMCLQVNSDAVFVFANLDAPRWHTSPLVKQGLASDRDLPGLQSHACKQNYVIISPLNSSISPINTFCPVSRGNRLYCRKTSKRRYSQ